MTPKEKAEQLYKRFQDSLPDAVEIDKLTIQQCALIAVDEILLGYMGNPKVKYWKEVKQQIESL